MKVIAYRVTLLEPALLTALEGEPNESVSFAYLPGSVLRGAVIGRYLGARKLKALDAAEEEVRRFFFDGTTRFLNGYPLDRLGGRALPVPLSWQQDKKAVARETESSPAPIYDLAVVGEPPEDLEQPQGVKAPFCTLSGDTVRLVSPERRLSVHTARNRRYGRAIKPTFEADGEPSGAVYRYEALGAGQSFEAFVLCDRDEDAQILLPLLEGEVFLGGSRSAGYGRARIVDARVVPSDWREAGGEPMAASNGKLTVTFLSDALLRDRNGQFTTYPEALTAALEAKLGTRLKQLQAFLRWEAVGGFNRKWGLPLPQALAVKMGSVVVYRLTDPASCDRSKLLELECRGIGERRAEGFGRLAFNWHGREKLKVEPRSSAHDLARPITDEESRRIAERMVARMFQRRLEGRLAAKAVRTANSLVDPQKLPSNAQISRLRSIFRNELMKKDGQNPDLRRLEHFLADIESRKSARRQFQKATIEGRPLLEWLRNALSQIEPSEWKDFLGISDADIPSLGGVRPLIDEVFRARQLLLYVDAVLAYASKAREGREIRND